MFGAVAFPVDNPTWRNSGEGGMFVKLVVVDDRDYDDSDWTICCGVSVSDLKSEELVGDDQLDPPALRFEEGEAPEEALQALDEHDRAARAWEERHFPSLNDEAAKGHGRYLSRNYLAAVTLGNTGWSGFSDALERYWHCTHDDLTSEGKALYASFQKLYPGCTLHLLTFLDT